MLHRRVEGAPQTMTVQDITTSAIGGTTLALVRFVVVVALTFLGLLALKLDENIGP